MPIPAWATSVKKGDSLTIKREMFTRGGQQGLVIEDDLLTGVSLDFFKDAFGDPKGLPSIEFYEWDEIEPLSVMD
jgi:hypothetical protein